MHYDHDYDNDKKQDTKSVFKTDNHSNLRKNFSLFSCQSFEQLLLNLFKILSMSHKNLPMLFQGKGRYLSYKINMFPLKQYKEFSMKLSQGSNVKLVSHKLNKLPVGSTFGGCNHYQRLAIHCQEPGGAGKLMLWSFLVYTMGSVCTVLCTIVENGYKKKRFLIRINYFIMAKLEIAKVSICKDDFFTICNFKLCAVLFPVLKKRDQKEQFLIINYFFYYGKT